MQVKFSTGRTYDAPQVLEIDFDLYSDDLELTTVRFSDASRRISGTVLVLGLEANSLDIGRAVLREYDAGRYAEVL